MENRRAVLKVLVEEIMEDDNFEDLGVEGRKY
jgi:hypothetical protein